MKFTRTALIDRVKAEIDRLEQATTSDNAEVQTKYQERRQQYLDRTGDAWKEFAATIRRRQNKNQPIVPGDIPAVLRDGRNGGHVAVWDYPDPKERVAPTGDLGTLLSLLESATDDEISTVSLERMGFRMAQLFRA